MGSEQTRSLTRFSLAAAVCAVFVVSGCSARYIPDPRKVPEEGWVKSVGLCRVCKGGVYGWATQDGYSLALCASPVGPGPVSHTPTHTTDFPLYLPQAPASDGSYQRGVGGVCKVPLSSNH